MSKTAMQLAISPKLYEAVIFELDGVLTKTEKVHTAAWQALFDDYLKERSEKDGKTYSSFDVSIDYPEYIDGKPRGDGVKSFLQSRGIHLPEGAPDDPPELETVCALGNRKNQFFHQILEQRGVDVYGSTVRFIRALRREGVKTAVVSASKNAGLVLEKAGLRDLFDAKIDGLDAISLNLRGKPAPDVFLAAARQLNAEPQRTAVVEDSIAGVQAGKTGHFKLVIGVDRGNNAERLAANGADIVVSDLLNLEETAASAKMELDFGGEPQDDWRLIYRDFDPEREGTREALCALGNGYFVTRGAAPESSDDGTHYPGTYIAGVYNRLRSEVAGRLLEHEDLVNMPNWLPLTFRIDEGVWFDLIAVEILSFRQELNLQEGILYRTIRFRDAHDRITRLEERRFVHMRHFHMAGLETRLTAENWTGFLDVRAALDGRVINNNIKRWRVLNRHHLQPLEFSLPEARHPAERLLFLKMRTNQSDIQVAQAARLTFRDSDRHPLHLESQPMLENDEPTQTVRLRLEPEDTLIVEKILALYTSRDPAISECGLEALEAARLAPDFETLLEDQREVWRHLWQLFDIDISVESEDNGQPHLPLILHLHIFHLLQTVSHNSIDFDVGIPARGWHGEGYRGHIFWDDLFVFPFIDLRKPEIAEALLKYRYRRLGKARVQAREQGLEGALFPWQSASNGREETPHEHYLAMEKRWIQDNTSAQKHVNAAIVYNIWHYYQVTGDMEFLNSYGGEIILEIARMFASLCVYHPGQERYEIKAVMGPDEYHDAYPNAPRGCGVNNNAYTNLMVVWTLCRALELLDILPAERRQVLCEKLGIHAESLALWEDISRKMMLPLQSDGIISQFEGYEHLEEFPYEAPLAQSVKAALLRTGGEMNRYKMSKQADVLMLFYLFSAEELQELFERLAYPFDSAWIPKNINYYLSRTAHGSTLSRVVHAWTLSRANRAKSWSLFQEALQSDVSDNQDGSTSEGVHLGAMAGTVDIVQRCYTGIVTRDDILWLNPCLPEPLKRMSFCLHYRKQSLRIEFTTEQLRVMARYSAAEPIKIGFKGSVHTLCAGETKTFSISEGRFVS